MEILLKFEKMCQENTQEFSPLFSKVATMSHAALVRERWVSCLNGNHEPRGPRPSPTLRELDRSALPNDANASSSSPACRSATCIFEFGSRGALLPGSLAHCIVYKRGGRQHRPAGPSLGFFHNTYVASSSQTSIAKPQSSASRSTAP